MARSQGDRRRAAAAAGALVEAVLRRHGVARDVREHRLVTSWEQIVGERVAARTTPDGLRDGVLRVRVSNSAWLHELSFLREAIAQRANEVAGEPPLVREVRLYVGRRNETDGADDVVAALARRKAAAAARRRPAAPARPPATAAQAKAIDAETEGVVDPELRAAIRALRKKLGL